MSRRAQQGFSLVAVLTATAVAGLVAVGMARLFTNSMAAQRHVEMANERTMTQANVRNILNQPGACMQTMSQVALTTDSFQDVTLKSNTGAVLLQPGTKSNGLTVQSIQAKPGTSTDGVYLVQLRVVTKKSGTAAQKSFGGSATSSTDDFFATVGSSGGTILACTYGGGGLQLVNTGFYSIAPAAPGKLRYLRTTDTSICVATDYCSGPVDYALMSTAVPLTGSVTFRADGNYLVFNWYADASAAHNSPSQGLCTWLWVDVQDQTTGASALSDFVGYACNTQTSLNRTMAAGTVIGHTYRVTYKFWGVTSNGVLNPGNYYVAGSSGGSFQVSQYVKSSP